MNIVNNILRGRQPNKTHRFKGEGPMYWCDQCGQRHVKHSKIGQKHWKAAGGS